MSHPDSNSADVEVTAGEIAYNAYCKELGGVAFTGDPLPTWKEQCDDPRKARVVSGWHAAGNAVIAAFQTHEVLSGKRGDHPVDVLYPPNYPNSPGLRPDGKDRGHGLLGDCI